MTRVIYKPCIYCKEDTAHRVGVRLARGKGKDLSLNYCLVCRKDYPSPRGRW